MKKKQPRTVRIGIVGTGGMANMHAQHFRAIPGCRLVAACDIDTPRCQEFAARHEIPEVHPNLPSLLKNSGCDAISIVTPDSSHKALAIESLRAGKHVLCEKPLALNARDAEEMLTVAQAAGVVHMVNFSYRGWPCIEMAAGLVRRGDLGEIRHVEASYLQSWLVSRQWGDWRDNPAWLWRLSTKHGSRGVLGDIGVHIVDYASYPVGPIREVSCRLKTFSKAPGNRIGKYRLDANDSAVLSVEFANGALGVIHTTRWMGGHANRLALKIAGTEGSLAMDSDLGTDTIRVCRGRDLHRGHWREMRCKPTPNIYRRFVTAIRTGQPGAPDFARGAEVQRVLDACFESDSRREPVRLR